MSMFISNHPAVGVIRGCLIGTRVCSDGDVRQEKFLDRGGRGVLLDSYISEIEYFEIGRHCPFGNEVE